MIIVEGPDGAGKTTLTEMLLASGVVSKILPSTRITAKGDVDRMKYETDRYLRLHGNNHRIAVDRFLFSEMAYGPIMRGKSSFTYGEYLHKLLDLKMDMCPIIFCLPEKLNFKPEEGKVLVERMPLIKALYQTMFNDISETYPR